MGRGKDRSYVDDDTTCHHHTPRFLQRLYGTTLATWCGMRRSAVVLLIVCSGAACAHRPPQEPQPPPTPPQAEPPTATTPANPPATPPSPPPPAEPAPPSATRVLKGIASWYGPGFDGRTTASGESFDEDALTAAHATLALGTRVRVVNLRNGRSVVVRINDRGPRYRNRLIDVSRGAAAALGMIQPGTAPVRLEVLADEGS
jgi:hypothetical protein